MHSDSGAPRDTSSLPRQIALPLCAKIRGNEEIFYRSACNDALASALRKVIDDTGCRAVRLTGPPNSGKTRLLKTLAGDIGGARYVRADAAPERISEGATVCLLDAIDDARDERTAFHHINAARESGAALIVADRGERRFSLPDLASRLGGLPSVAMPPPDPELLEALLAERFAARQLRPSAFVLRFIAERIERDYAAPENAASALDAASMAQGVPVTRALVKATLFSPA